MKILEKEFEVDFYDAEIMEKIESGMEKVNKAVKENMQKKQEKTSLVIRKVCSIIFDFFDSVLGEGSSKEIFGNKTSLTICIKAYEDFINAKKEQDQVFEDISKKYSPNRATRRAKK